MLKKRLPIKNCQGKSKETCSRIITTRIKQNLYNNSLSHKQEHEFALVVIGKKVAPRCVCGSVLTLWTPV